MAGKDKEQEAKLMENPTEFFIDFLDDMYKAFKEGLTGKSQKKKDPQEQMQEMMESMMHMFEGMQKMQKEQMQMQMKQMQEPKPAKQEPAAQNAQPQNARQQAPQMPNIQMPNIQMPGMQMPNMQMAGMQMPGMQMPGMQMPGMQMPGMQMPGMQMPGMQMPGMQMPNMQMPGMQIPGMQMLGMQMPGMQMPGMQMPNMQMPNMGNDANSMMMGVVMQLAQLMMYGMMQYMQMQQQAPEVQQQAPQNQQQEPQNQQAPEVQQQAPEVQQAPPVNQQQAPEMQYQKPGMQQTPGNPEQNDGPAPMFRQEGPAPMVQQQAPVPEKELEERVKEEKNEGPVPTDQEFADSIKELKEANKAYNEAKRENDALAAVQDKVAKDDKRIERAQREMDSSIDAIAALKAKKDTTLQQDREEYNKELEASGKDSQISAANRTSLAFDEVKVDAVQWGYTDLTQAAAGVGGLDTKNMDKSIQDATQNYANAIAEFNNKYENIQDIKAEDTIKTYDAAKQFLDATRPRMKELSGPDKGTVVLEKLSPEMQKAREGAQKLVDALDGMKEAKIREKVAERAEAKGPNVENNPAGRNIQWFSKQEVDKAINAFDNMKKQDGKLTPGAEKFHNALKNLRYGMISNDKGINADAYVKAFDAADDFMKESINSRKSGPDVDAARQAAKDVRKRLKENNRIDKLKTIDSFEKKQEMLREKAGKLNEREQEQARRDQKIDKLKTHMRGVRGERDRLNSEQHKENKKKLEESNKKLEAARKRREEAKNRSFNAQQRSQSKKAPQKKAAGMGM